MSLENDGYFGDQIAMSSKLFKKLSNWPLMSVISTFSSNLRLHCKALIRRPGGSPQMGPGQQLAHLEAGCWKGW